MKRAVGAGILGLTMMLLLAMPAAAQPWWCEDDPILHFSDGTSVRLVTSFSPTERTLSSVVTYDVQVPSGVTVRVTKPASGQVDSKVYVTGGGIAGSASITVTVSGASAITVTQTGGGAGKQTYSGIGGTAAFSLTLGG